MDDGRSACEVTPQSARSQPRRYTAAPTSTHWRARRQMRSSSLGSSSASTKGRVMTLAISNRVRPAAAQVFSSVVQTSRTRRHSGRRMGSSWRRIVLSRYDAGREEQPGGTSANPP